MGAGDAIASSHRASLLAGYSAGVGWDAPPDTPVSVRVVLQLWTLIDNRHYCLGDHAIYLLRREHHGRCCSSSSAEFFADGSGHDAIDDRCRGPLLAWAHSVPSGLGLRLWRGLWLWPVCAAGVALSFAVGHRRCRLWLSLWRRLAGAGGVALRFAGIREADSADRSRRRKRDTHRQDGEGDAGEGGMHVCERLSCVAPFA